MIKVSLIVLSGLAAAGLLRRHSAALRHWVIAMAVSCAAVTPLLQLFAPTWTLPLPTSSSPAAIASVETIGAAAVEGAPPHGTTQALFAVARDSSEGSAPSLMFALRWIWLTGVAVSVCVLLVGFARLTWITSRAQRLRRGRWVELAESIAVQLGITRPVALLQSTHPTLLVTYGWWRPRIVLPSGANDWPESRIRVVLGHELAHIRRADWLALMIVELTRAVYWFNPLLWMAARRLGQESEQACDDIVLGLGIDPADYAAQLLDLARAASSCGGRARGLPAPAVVRTSNLERRVMIMLNTRINRQPATGATRLATTVGILLLAVLVSGFGAVAQSLSTFSGSVTDPTQNGIPGATLVLTNVANQAKHEVRSDERGRFEFVGLPPGDYLLEATFPGFAALKGSVRIAGQDVERTLAMEVGSLMETIHVAAAGRADTARTSSVRQPRTAVTPRSVEDCRPSSTGGNIRPPMKLRDVRPIYPAHLEGTGGAVVLNARIGIDGAVRTVDVVESADPSLAAAAEDAVRQWQFDPTLLNCVPIEVAMKVHVTFKSK